MNAGMNITSAILAVTVVVGGLLAGCVPTAVYPFYGAADVVQESGLLGSWKSADATWTFSPGSGKSYKVEIASENQRVECVGHLFRIGDERFLDLYAAEQALEAKLQDNPYGLGLIPVHVLFRVRATQPKLAMSGLGPDWLKELLKREPKAAPHVILPDGRVVLTGTTEALQAFVKQHLKDGEAWNEMYEEGLVKAVAKPAEK
jgi:hypothetical protein